MILFQSNIINIYGKRGEEWLKHLPIIIDKLAKKWSLSDLKALDNLSYNYICSGYQNNLPIILKLGLDIESIKHEAHVLSLYSMKDCGVVKVLAQEGGALLLARAVPGVSLKSYFPHRNKEAVQITCRVIERLHKAPLNVDLPDISDWLKILDNEYDIPANYLQKARELRNKLLSTSGKKVLLHGDLHHDNILLNGKDWLVIDPKGVIGEATYEVAAFIRNPIPGLLDNSNAMNIIMDSIISFSEILGLDMNRVKDWCFVQAVLSWIWALEDDSSNTDYFRRLVMILDE